MRKNDDVQQRSEKDFQPESTCGDPTKYCASDQGKDVFGLTVERVRTSKPRSELLSVPTMEAKVKQVLKVRALTQKIVGYQEKAAAANPARGRTDR